MPWNLKEIPAPSFLPPEGWDPGTCWRTPLESTDTFLDAHFPNWRKETSTIFLVSGRDFVWTVVLPPQKFLYLWTPDFRMGTQEWIVTGADNPETLTVTPKVNIPNVYRGDLINGVLSDDLEGRID